MDGRDRRLTPEEKAKREARKDANTEEITPGKANKKAKEAKRLKETGFSGKEQELHYKRLQIQFQKDAVEGNPARALSRYAPKRGENAGTLPEVTGVGKSEFARRGDDIVTELGFEDSEHAREEFAKYVKQRQRLADMIASVREYTTDYKNQEKVLQALRKEIQEEGLSRQKQLDTVKEFFHFSTNEWNRVLKKLQFQDPRLYNESQWQKFMEKMEVEGEATFRAIERRVELKALIWERDFKKTENLFKAMSLPNIENMSEAQVKQMIDVLEQFKTGDEFLTKRQIETVKNTDIKDIRTIREALESLAKDAGVPPGSIGDVSYREMDNYRYDTALAESNPFYKVMVTEKNRAFLEAGENVIRIRQRMDELIGKARKSRPQSFLQKAIPTDERIFNWLEADALGKMKMAEEMTAEEIEAGVYVRNLFEQARDYLVQHQVLKKYRSDYITHVRRGFLEAWKDDGFMKAVKESFEQYKQDEQYFNILDGDTGEILPLEKFFQFSMKRTGGLTPSKNVSKAVESYFHSFEKKVALDSLVPKIDIYAHALSPRVYSERGLELDRSLKKFVRRWLNTKKGRVAETIVKPGGKVDWVLRSGVALTRMLDLGFSIPAGIASIVGEQATTYTLMGAGKMALGTRRIATKKGQEILKNYENFIGEGVIGRLKQTSGSAGDKLMTGMFGFFTESARLANAQYLLGTMTKDEFAKGIISPKRLAELQRDLGRYRVVEGAESVMGKTALGKVGTQYKSWAVPIMRTSVDNLQTVARLVRQDGLKAVLKRKETHELLRSALMAGTISLAVGGYARSLQDKKDRNFMEEIVAKAYRDSLTIIGAMDPSLFTSEPRFLGFINDLLQGMGDIVTFEDGLFSPKLDKLKSGENKGDNRGISKLKKTLTPKAVSTGIKAVEGATEEEKGPGIDVPEIPSIPKPKLPKRPELPRL